MQDRACLEVKLSHLQQKLDISGVTQSAEMQRLRSELVQVTRQRDGLSYQNDLQRQQLNALCKLADAKGSVADAALTDAQRLQASGVNAAAQVRSYQLSRSLVGKKSFMKSV